LREQETQTFLVPAKDEQTARAKLPYYADWITPRSASRASIAQVLPAKAENMPDEPEYKNQDFGFQFNIRGQSGAGSTLTHKISAPNRASAVEKLSQQVRDGYGVMARIENFKEIDPARIKDGRLLDAPEEASFKVEVKIQSGDRVDYKILDVKAKDKYEAQNKALEYAKNQNPTSTLSATIADQS